MIPEEIGHLEDTVVIYDTVVDDRSTVWPEPKCDVPVVPEPPRRQRREVDRRPNRGTLEHVPTVFLT